MVFYDEIPDKLKEIQQFSRWRSAEIMKAIKENREPEPIGDVDLGLDKDEDEKDNDIIMDIDNKAEDIDIPDAPVFSNENEIKNDNLDQSPPPSDTKDIPSQPSFKDEDINQTKEMNLPKPESSEPKENKPLQPENNSEQSSIQIQQQSNGRKLIPSKTVPKQITYTDQNDIMEATRYAKFAVSALMFDDTATAIDNLKKALNILTKE